MNIFEALTVNDSFTAALRVGPSMIAEEPEAVPSPESYREIWNAAAAEIADTYEEGTGAFVREYNPGLHERLQRAREAMETTWGGNDIEVFGVSVARWKDLHLEGIRLFENERSSY